MTLIWAVTIPRLPSRELNQNRSTRAGSHWSAFAKAKKQDTEDAMACCLAVGRERYMPWDAVDLHVHFVIPYVKSPARRDWDNLIGTLKGFQDGLVKAQVLTDDSMQVIKRFSFSAEWRQTDGPGETRFMVTRHEMV